MKRIFKPYSRKTETNNERNMDMKIFRIGCLTVALIPALTIGGASEPPAENTQGHRSGLAAKVVSSDGTSRTVKLQGVGCSESICSRVFIRSKGEDGAPQKTWLDSIASITRQTANDALLVMKDGSERRAALLSDFRVLYVSTANGGAQKLDLGGIQSLEFVSQNRNR